MASEGRPCFPIALFALQHPGERRLFVHLQRASIAAGDYPEPPPVVPVYIDVPCDETALVTFREDGSVEGLDRYRREA